MRLNAHGIENTNFSDIYKHDTSEKAACPNSKMAPNSTPPIMKNRQTATLIKVKPLTRLWRDQSGESLWMGC